MRFNLPFCFRKVTKATSDQLQKLWHTTNIYLHPNLAEYTQKLTDRFPGDLKVNKVKF